MSRSMLRSGLLAALLALGGATPALAQDDGAEEGGDAEGGADEGVPDEGAPGEGDTAGEGEAGAGEGDGDGDDGSEGDGEGEEGDVPEPPGDPTPEEAEGEGEAPDDRMQVVVVDAAPYGIDPVVGQHVTNRARATAEELGYRVLDRDATVAHAQELRMPYPPTPADLWRLTYATDSQRGVFARVWAHSGQYVIEITVASMDGTGPFFARGTSGSDDLHQVVAGLVREALPPPSAWEGPYDPEEIERQRREQAAEAQRRMEEERRRQHMEERERRLEEQRERERRRVRRHWNLVLQTEGAIGTSQDSFYNHLVGGRLDYRVSQEILFGAYVGYANLRGKDGRASNVLMYLQVEDRVRITSTSDITVPLRLGVGYLPFNGPVVRLAAGVNLPLSRDVELGFDILTPTFWVLPDRTAVSLNLAAELVWRL